MQIQSRKNPTAVHSACLDSTPPSAQLYTVAQFAERQPAFTEAALRALIFNAEPRHSTRGEISGNGLIECGALIRIGRKVLIDETQFLEWARSLANKGVR